MLTFIDLLVELEEAKQRNASYEILLAKAIHDHGPITCTKKEYASICGNDGVNLHIGTRERTLFGHIESVESDECLMPDLIDAASSNGS